MFIYKYVKNLLEDISEEEEASNPATNPNRLFQLIHHPSEKIHKLIAQNPNTPPLGLRILMPNYPDAVMENPALPLFQLEDPQLKQIIPQEEEDYQGAYPETYNMAAKTSHPLLLNLLADHHDEGVQSTVAQNMATPTHVLSKLAQSPHYETRMIVARHKNTDPRVVKNMLNDEEDRVRSTAATNVKNLTDEEWNGILNHEEDPYLSTQLIFNHNTPSHILHKVAQQPDSIMIGHDHFVKHPNVHSDTLDLLARQNNPYLQELIAKHPKTKQKTLDYLSKLNYKR